jgi:hypothetical protein
MLYSFLFGPSSPFFYSTAADDESNTTKQSSGGPGTAAASWSLHHPSAHAAARNAGYAPSGWGGDALKNRLFFTFVFVETISWLWVWVTLQEERREVLARKARRRSGSSGQGF